MRQTITLAALLLFILNSAVVFAEDRVDHFAGKASNNIAQAQSNLTAYNRKIAALLAENKFTTSDMAEIHHITYTLENALAHMADQLKQLQEDLEKIHLASERNDASTIRAVTPGYLLTSKQLFE